MAYKNIDLICPQAQAEAFCILFQEGVLLSIPGNVSLSELFTSIWGLDAQFIQERVQTIFLDGHPVDIPDKIIPENMSTLALSAAMPGLVGATMRKSGPLAVLRESITFQANKSATHSSDKLLCLKLFNFLLKELGPHFLKQGVIIKACRLQEVLRRYPWSFWQTCKLYIDRQNPLPFDQIELYNLGSADIQITLSIDNKSN